MKFARNHAKASMFSKKFSYSIAVLFLVAILFTVIGTVFVSIALKSSKTDEDITLASKSVNSFVSEFFNDKFQMISDGAKSNSVCDFLLEQDISKTAEIDELFSNFCSDENILSAFVMSENGEVFYSDKESTLIHGSYNPSSWKNDFQVAQTENTINVSKIEESNFTLEKEVITIVSSINIEDLFVGYLGIEVDVNSLFSVLDIYSANSYSFPVIATTSGALIFEPENNMYSEFNMDFSDQIASTIHNYNHIENGIDYFSCDSFEKVKYHIDSKAVPNWRVYVFFYNKDMSLQIQDFLWYFISIDFVCLAVLFLIIMRKLNFQIKDLDVIEEKAEKLVKSDSSDKLDLSEKSGFYSLGESLNEISNVLIEKENLILKQTNIDQLTELPNRFSLYKDLKKRIASVKSPCDEKFAVLVIDIDNFKWLNENMGHKFGDEILCKFAKIILSSFSEENLCYRFNGDEFVIILPFGNDYDIINSTIKQIRKQFTSAVKIFGDHIYIRFSIGISIYPDNESNVDALIRNAEIALRKAKETGKEQEAYYSNIVEKQSYNTAAIAKNISTALENEEFHINYQPILDAQTSDIYGFEALLRWNSRSFGNISPTEFINVAETTGDIIQIGSWIFESSCRFLKKLCDNYRDDIIISINVSAVQLNRPDYIEHVKRVIEITQVNPKNIQVEITESALVDFKEGNNAIAELDKLGITLALDDFGTGYSSLSYLKKFPIKCLKIDKSFIDEISNSDRDYTISNSIIELVHGLNIKTIAEGIETFDQYSFLKDMNCDYIQGFLMSKPLNEDTALDFVRMYDELHKPTIDVLKENGYLLEKEKMTKL